MSPALIQYHFGTKEGLRAACDTWALGWLDSHWIEGLEHGRYSDPAYLSGAMSSAEPILGYLVTAFASNSSVASTWYDRVRHRMRDILHDGLIGPPVTEEDDIDAVSAVMAAMALGITLFYKEIARCWKPRIFPSRRCCASGERIAARARAIVGPGSGSNRAPALRLCQAIDAASSDDTANSDDSTSSPLHQQRRRGMTNSPAIDVHNLSRPTGRSRRSINSPCRRLAPFMVSSINGDETTAIRVLLGSGRQRSGHSA